MQEHFYTTLGGQLIFQSAEDVSAKVMKMTDSGLYF